MLSNLSHPNIVKLYSTFQDAKKLYFILEYCPNRDFSDLIRLQGKLNQECTKFCVAQIVLALEYIHKKNIYHRDLKPENILLDYKFHLKLCDFATANVRGMFFDKSVMKFVKNENNKNSNNGSQELKKITEEKNLPRGESKSNNLRKSDSYEEEEDSPVHNMNKDLVGTAEYVSPEVLLGQTEDIGPPVDLWALGCIIYFCLTGRTPFKDKTNSLIFKKIINLDYKLQNPCIDCSARDLILKLLTKEPYKRLGAGKKGECNDYEALKSHDFFKGINWEKVNQQDSPILNLNINQLNLMNLSLSTNKISDSLSPRRTNCNLKIKDEGEISNSSLYSNNSVTEYDIINLRRLNTFDLSTPSNLAAITSPNMSTCNNSEDDKSEISELDLSRFQSNYSADQNNEINNNIQISQKYYLENDSVIPKLVMQDTVQKKSPWFHYNTRILKLFSNGRLEYFEPEKKNFKGSVSLTPECKAVYNDEYKFDINTKTRKYVFLVNSKTAKIWVDKINKVIESLT
jgi:serine/threonine protein kinase